MDDKNMQGVEAGGFLFLNGADANLADKERMQIEYLEKKLNYQNPEQIFSFTKVYRGENLQDTYRNDIFEKNAGFFDE